MKKLVSLSLALIMVLSLFAGCGSKAEPAAPAAPEAPAAEAPAAEAPAAEAPAAEAPKKALKVALICSMSGLGDRSFNDSAWEGMQRAEKELGVEIKAIEPKSIPEEETAVTTLCNSGYDLIVVLGDDWLDILADVAPKYPDVKFCGLNLKGSVPGDNVAVARTADMDVGFMVGALAAMMTKTNTLGVIGGMDIPSQVRFHVGFEEGAKYINPDVDVKVAFVGDFADPTTGKEYSLELINQGADVLFHTAGKSGEGMFEAIRENDGIYGIGVDLNQDDIVEGKVLTTAEKRLGNIAYDMCKRVQDGTFEPGDQDYSLSNGGVGITEMEFTKDIIGAEKIAKLEQIKQDIMSGKIVVTDIYKN